MKYGQTNRTMEMLHEALSDFFHNPRSSKTTTEAEKGEVRELLLSIIGTPVLYWRDRPGCKGKSGSTADPWSRLPHYKLLWSSKEDGSV